MVLPGVGDFYNCKNQLNENKRNARSLEIILLTCKKRPFLGICIGMQLMAKKSFERFESQGLGFFDSEVKKILLVQSK